MLSRSFCPPRRVLIVVGVCFLFVVLSLFGCSRQGVAFSKSILFVPQIFDIGISPLEWLTPKPLIERLSVVDSSHAIDVDVYRPGAEGEFPAVLLFLGVAPATPDDPRIVSLGEALARSGIVALFYWSPEMARGHIAAADIANLLTVFNFIKELEYVDSANVGMGGFCVGASFVLIAASDETIRDEVSFVSAFGPYFDLRDVVGATVSEQTAYRGNVRSWIPDLLTKSTFHEHLTRDLIPGERATIRNAIESGLALDAQAIQLSGEGLAAYRLLQGTSPDHAKELLLSIPDETIRSMDEVSPRHYIHNLKAPILILHDRDDELISVDESRRLVDHIVDSTDVTYTEYTNIFSHVSPIRSLSLGSIKDIFKFIWHMHAVMMQIT